MKRSIELNEQFVYHWWVGYCGVQSESDTAVDQQGAGKAWSFSFTKTESSVCLIIREQGIKVGELIYILKVIPPKLFSYLVPCSLEDNVTACIGWMLRKGWQWIQSLLGCPRMRNRLHILFSHNLFLFSVASPREAVCGIRPPPSPL